MPVVRQIVAPVSKDFFPLDVSTSVLDGGLIRRPAKNARRKCEPCLVRVSRRRVWSSELLLLSLRCHCVTIVQPAERRKGLNLAFTGRANFCCTTCWRVLRQSRMRPVLMVIEQEDVSRLRCRSFRMIKWSSKSRNFPPNAQQHRSATDCQRPCELARFPCLSRPKSHRRQTWRRGRIARIYAAVCRPMLLAIAGQPKAHGDFSSHCYAGSYAGRGR